MQLLDIDPGELSDPKVVAERFLRKFPPGTTASEAARFKSGGDASCESFANPKLLVCKYIYEENDVHRRGYSVVYFLDDASRITGARAMRAYKPLKRGS
jgi:hypothetical protein